MEKEIWRYIKGYEGRYQVSNLGRVRSLRRHRVRGKIMDVACNGHYWRIKLSKNNKAKRVLLHRIIAETFIPNPENKPQVNHINGDKKDNSIENLEWCTRSENQLHAIRTGLRPMKTKTGTKVINTITGKVFESIKQASREKGIDRCYLGLKLKGEIKNNTEYIFYSEYNPSK